MSDDDKDLKAIQKGSVLKSMRSKSHSFSRRNYDEAQSEKAIREERVVAERAAQTTLQIRMHKGTREDSYLTLETIDATPTAVLDYLKRRYEKDFNPSELRLNLYARGAPRVDWDYIYVIECAQGVLAFTDRKIELS